MSQFNDCKFAALVALGFTGAVNDMELEWLQSLGATANQLNDAWLEVAGAGQYNEQKFAWFKAQGAVGETYNDVEFDYWCNVQGGAAVGILPAELGDPNIVGYNQSFGDLNPVTFLGETVDSFEVNVNTNRITLAFAGNVTPFIAIQVMVGGSNYILTSNGTDYENEYIPDSIQAHAELTLSIGVWITFGVVESTLNFLLNEDNFVFHTNDNQPLLAE